MIVITGRNGYISKGLKKFLTEKGHKVKSVSVRGEIDEDIFKDADVVVHAAGIVHIKAEKRLYHEVNYELTKKLAEIAKESEVGHFIFISTMSVYGKTEGEINKDTPLLPNNPYGKSKLLAENAVLKLTDDKFSVTVIRPPMVYGKGCPGNYARLSALVRRIPLFPLVNNKRSMIFCGNLYNCIKKIIDNNIVGIITPQNSEYVNTSVLCQKIAECANKKLELSSFFGSIVSSLPLGIAKKMFGSLYYGEDTAFSADIVDFDTSVRITEK